MKNILTIAGSDSSGGAGVQADLKTFAAHGQYGMSAITALTSQNTTGVFDVVNLSPEFLTSQIKSVFDDIPPHAVKIGMVSNLDLIKTIAENLKVYQANCIVLDPVMISTSGSRLLDEDAISALIQDMLPMATIITPNIAEAEVLSGLIIKSKEDMLLAAKKIAELTPAAILIKGGHLEDCADDLLFNQGNAFWFESSRVDNYNTHGTGCTLSSAIACNLAEGLSITESVANAKAYIIEALRDGLDLGKGSGPLNHQFSIKPYKNTNKLFLIDFLNSQC